MYLRVAGPAAPTVPIDTLLFLPGTAYFIQPELEQRIILADSFHHRLGKSFIIGMEGQIPVICHLQGLLGLPLIQQPQLPTAPDDFFRRCRINAFLYIKILFNTFPQQFKRKFEPLDQGIPFHLG